tara:strand:- start:80 stop:796 length:717 start_codon:yes stop_codon:yes gene_type:complete
VTNLVLKAGRKKMITENDIITYSISEKTKSLCLENAKLCNICGISYVPVEGHEMTPAEKRKNKDYKKNNLEYQFIGQLTTCAATEWVFGDKTKTYQNVREKQNETPYDGDGGIDIPPYNIDVKGSRMRSRGRGLLDYNFPLRPVERHKGIQYIFSLVSFDQGFKNCKAHLMGWMGEEEITSKIQTDGVFKGAYLTRVRDLNPLPDKSFSTDEKVKKINAQHYIPKNKNLFIHINNITF